MAIPILSLLLLLLSLLSLSNAESGRVCRVNLNNHLAAVLSDAYCQAACTHNPPAEWCISQSPFDYCICTTRSASHTAPHVPSHLPSASPAPRTTAPVSQPTATPSAHPAGSDDAVFERIPGGPGTFCGDQSQFAIFVRHGDPQRVVISFEGGGSCVDYDSCIAPGSSGALKNRIVDFAASVQGAGIGFEEAPQAYRGPFARKIPFAENGLIMNEWLDVADWTKIFVPYCTQDYGLGRNNFTYQKNGQSQVFHHNGLANTHFALDYVFSNFRRPKQIVTGGCSAGSINAMYASTQIEKHYGGQEGPEPAYVLFLDSAFLVSTPIAPLLGASWGAECALMFLLDGTVDLTSVSDYNQPLLLGRAAEAVARKSSGFVMLYAVYTDPESTAYAASNPIIGPGRTLYPQDGRTNNYRDLFGRLQQLDNVRLFIVDTFTSLEESYNAAGEFTNPDMAGIAHCGTNAGCMVFTFFAPEPLALYRHVFAENFTLPYLGFRSNAEPDNFMSSIEWFNQVVGASSPRELPESIVCDTCTSLLGAGCDGGVGDDFVPYNACGGCGDKNRCTLTDSGDVLVLDAAAEIFLRGKSLSTVISEQLSASRGATFPVLSFASYYRMIKPSCLASPSYAN